MSAIFISLDSVRRLNEELRRCSLQLGTLSSGVQQAKCGLDPRIQARRNIHQRASDSCRRLVELEERLSRLISFNEFAVHSYDSIENRLVKEAERLFSGARGGLDRLYQYYSRILDNGQLVALRGLVLDSVDNYLSYQNRFTLFDQLKFRLFSKNGNVYFQIKNGAMFKELLQDVYGDMNKWDRSFVNRLSYKGVPIYDRKQKKIYNSNKNKLYHTPFNSIKDSLDEFQLSLKERVLKSMKSESAAAVKVWDDFRGWKGATTASKLTKASGIIGTTVTTFDNFFESFYNADSREWDFSNGQNKQEFAVGVGVDIGANVAAAAAGAAVGSLFLPPAGTVVGAAMGIGVNFVLNTPFIGTPPESIVDFTKEKVNEAIDYFQENSWSDIRQDLTNMASNAVDELNEFASSASEFLDDTGKFISGIGKNISKLVW